MSDRSHVTTHVLDAMTGEPAAGVQVALDLLGDNDTPSTRIASGLTDVDGRVSVLGPQSLTEGNYRITFESGSYFAARGIDTFYPEVTIAFTLADESAHYHVPLLLSPFAFSTYRGS